MHLHVIWSGALHGDAARLGEEVRLLGRPRGAAPVSRRDWQSHQGVRNSNPARFLSRFVSLALSRSLSRSIFLSLFRFLSLSLALSFSRHPGPWTAAVPRGHRQSHQGVSISSEPLHALSLLLSLDLSCPLALSRSLSFSPFLSLSLSRPLALYP